MNPRESEQSVAKLLKLSGERDSPSAEGMAHARMAAQASWQRMLGQNKKILWHRSWLKISFAFAVGMACLLLISHNTTSITVVTAHVVDIEGDVSITPGAVIHAGQQLVTKNGRIALLLGDSLSLRLDQQTQLRIDDADHISLLQGRIYVDSGGLNARAALCIVTPAGEVRHVGTQFQVHVQGDTTQVRVREGHVQLSLHDTTAHYIAAGEELQVVGSQVVLRRGLPAYGADWEWAAAIVPALDIENRPLAEFLTWLAREHGWQLHYANDSLQQRTHEIRLHGSLERMNSNDLMEHISLITGVSIGSRDGILSVGNSK